MEVRGDCELFSEISNEGGTENGTENGTKNEKQMSRREFLELALKTMGAALLVVNNSFYEFIERLTESDKSDDPVLEEIYKLFPPEPLPNLSLEEILEYENFEPDFDSPPRNTPKGRAPAQAEVAEEYHLQVQEFLQKKGYQIDETSPLFSSSKLLNEKTVQNFLLVPAALLAPDLRVLTSATIAKGIFAFIIIAGVTYAIYEASKLNYKPIDCNHTDARHNPYHLWGREARDKIAELIRRVGSGDKKDMPFACLLLDAGDRLAKGVTRYAWTYPISASKKGFVIVIMDQLSNGKSKYVTAYRVKGGYYGDSSAVIATSKILEGATLLKENICPNLPPVPVFP